jgi:hypothetical protein
MPYLIRTIPSQLWGKGFVCGPEWLDRFALHYPPRGCFAPRSVYVIGVMQACCTGEMQRYCISSVASHSGHIWGGFPARLQVDSLRVIDSTHARPPKPPTPPRLLVEPPETGKSRVAALAAAAQPPGNCAPTACAYGRLAAGKPRQLLGLPGFPA